MYITVTADVDVMEVLRDVDDDLLEDEIYRRGLRNAQMDLEDILREYGMMIAIGRQGEADEIIADLYRQVVGVAMPPKVAC